MKNSETNKKKSYWRWIPWIIIIVLIITSLNDSRLDEYNYCVNECIFDINSCLDYPGFLSDSCIDESDVSSCLSILEICISDCELNHRY